jgi:hypothetical protein
MKHRSRFSPTNRKIRSALTKIVHDQGLVRGTIITMKRACGNPNCRCAKGHKHVSLYLSRSEGGRPKMLFIPKDYEAMVKRWTKNYRRVKELMEEISNDLWAGIKERRFG